MSGVLAILSDPVTTHMRTDPTKVRVDATIEQALAAIRDHEIGGRVVYFYVVDHEDRLVGVIPTRRLLRAKPTDPIGDVMIRNVIKIPHTATVLEACEFFTMHRLLAFPVVDGDDKLIGLIDIDLYTEELEDLERRREGEDLFQLVGVHLTDAEQAKTFLSARKRFPWLLCNVIGGMIAALISDVYSDISTLVVVTPFIALVTGMAEGVSIQSVSLALQALHGRVPSWKQISRRLGRELLVGLLLGLFCGSLAGAISWVWKGDGMAGLSLFIGITGGVVASAGIGIALPFGLRLVKCDPRVASGPIALALADMVTLIFYFNLGRWLLK
jgi:magnesium transporter